jgi:hypothetical protein
MKAVIGSFSTACMLLALAVSARAQEVSVPSIRQIATNDIFGWVVLGAIMGFIINATHPDYQGIRAVFARYTNTAVSLWITIPLDLLFFLVLGPLIVTAAYAPAGVFQGVTLGLGWPLVIRGAVSNLNRNPPTGG